MLKSLAIVPYNFIRKRYNYNALLTRLIYMDYMSMRGLTKAEEGIRKNWVQVFRKSPYSSRYLVNVNLDILGYWHFVALKEPYFKKAKKGLLLDSEIKAGSIYSLNRRGLYKIYLVETMLLPRYRDTNAIKMLDNSFFDAVYDFASNGIYFTEVLSNAFTPDGKKMDMKRGMKLVAKHILNGSMYHMDFGDFLLKDTYQRTDVLKLYSRHIKQKTKETSSYI